MRRSAWLSLAAVSLLARAPATRAAARPRYGGSLRAEIREALASRDPAGWPARLVPLVYDRLVRLDENGRPQPALALSWQYDAPTQQWRFRLRPGVRFHDGSPVTPEAVVAGLRTWNNISVAGEMLVIQSANPMPDLVEQLAGGRSAIVRTGADGNLIGSGPFRITDWQPGRRATLAANEDYWEGRPFPDTIEVQMGRSPRDQLIDLELGKADLVEISPDEARRAAQRGTRIWTSAPTELIALVFERGRAAVEDARLREAIALSIDRGAIHNVLLQKQGEPTGALLPQWLSGYAFLFATTVDLARARQLAVTLPKAQRFSLSYDAADPVARAVAERIAVNAREAGIALQVATAATPDMRLARVRLSSIEPAQALAGFAGAFGLAESLSLPVPARPEAIYAAELKLLDGFRVVPLFHLPEIHGLGPRVKNWTAWRWGDWRLEDVYLEGPTP